MFTIAPYTANQKRRFLKVTLWRCSFFTRKWYKEVDSHLQAIVWTTNLKHELNEEGWKIKSIKYAALCSKILPAWKPSLLPHLNFMIKYMFSASNIMNYTSIKTYNLYRTHNVIHHRTKSTVRYVLCRHTTFLTWRCSELGSHMFFSHITQKMSEVHKTVLE